MGQAIFAQRSCRHGLGHMPHPRPLIWVVAEDQMATAALFERP